MLPEPSIKISSKSHLESTGVVVGFKLYNVEKAFLNPGYFYRSSPVYWGHCVLPGLAGSQDDFPYHLGIGGGDRCGWLIAAIKFAPRDGLNIKPVGGFEKPSFSYLQFIRKINNRNSALGIGLGSNIRLIR